MSIQSVHLAERVIAQRLVRDIIRLRHTVSVWEGEGWAIQKSNDEAAIFEAMASTDCDKLVIRDAQGVLVGWVLLIYGNDVDLISDYSDNPAIEALVKPVYAWIEGETP